MGDKATLWTPGKEVWLGEAEDRGKRVAQKEFLLDVPPPAEASSPAISVHRVRNLVS
jgi:hypothetical protein